MPNENSTETLRDRIMGAGVQPPEYPIFQGTITPAGGFIVYAEWPDGTVEPMAFTNAADFSTWANRSADRVVTKLKQGQQAAQAEVTGKPLEDMLPLRERIHTITAAPPPPGSKMEEDPNNIRTSTKNIAQRLRPYLGGRK